MVVAKKSGKSRRRDATGAGVMDFLKAPIGRFKRAVSGHRLDYPPPVRKLLAEIGHLPIVGLTVSRAPIKSGLNKALDVVSLGGWSAAKKKFGYDEMFHLALLADLGNGIRVVIEKNEVINVNPAHKADPAAQYITVPGSRFPQLSVLLDNARRQMGDQQFFVYDPFKQNCQVFVRGLLKASGLYNQQLDRFIFQPVDQLVKELPAWTAPVARAVTDLGHAVNVALEGGRRARPPLTTGRKGKVYRSVGIPNPVSRIDKLLVAVVGGVLASL